MSSKTLQCSHFNLPKLISILELENITSHLRKLVLHGSPYTDTSINTDSTGKPSLGLLSTLENGSPQWRQSSWNQLPVQEQAHGQTLVTQYLMPNSLFQSWKVWYWKPFQNFGVSVKLQHMHVLSLSHCSEGAPPAPGNALNKSSSMQQGELEQHPVGSITSLWHCQGMHTCCCTLHQTAQSLGQNGRSAEAGTPWIFSSCSPVRAPLLLLPIPSAPLCSTEGRRAPAPCSMVLKVTGKAKRKNYCTRSKKAKGQRDIK